MQIKHIISPRQKKNLEIHSSDKSNNPHSILIHQFHLIHHCQKFTKTKKTHSNFHHHFFHPKSIARAQKKQLLFVLLLLRCHRFAKLLQVPLHIFNSKPTCGWRRKNRRGPFWCCIVFTSLRIYTRLKLTNENGKFQPFESMYLLSKMVIFQPTMLVLPSEIIWVETLHHEDCLNSIFIDTWIVDFYRINECVYIYIYTIRRYRRS